MSTRKLTVTSCDVKREGTSSSGRDWTLYEVAVIDEQDTPIDEEFISFDMLPMGQLVEYEIEKKDSAEYGVSYMLKLPKGMKAGARPNVQAQIRDLSQRVARLESQAGALIGTTTGSSPAIPVAAAGSPALASLAGDEEIPF